MPKFLSITILILVVAGHVFAVKEYTPPVQNDKAILLEDLYFDEQYKDYGPIEIIESPLVGEGMSSSMYIDNGEDCIFFDNDGIPWLEECPLPVVPTF